MIACQLSREAWTWCVPSHLALVVKYVLSFNYKRTVNILYLYQQQDFSSPTGLYEPFLKENPRCYRQGRKQLRVSSPLLLASE